MQGLSIKDSNSQTVTNITISMNVGPNDRIITPINSDFIGADIARTADIKNVSGVNDGTNWTSLTIGSDTYGLASGGSSEPVNWSDILNKPTFATVATSGSYNDLSDKPTIPTKTSQLTNDSGFITSNALNGYATETWVEQKGYLTSVAWGDITDKPTFATVATSGSYNDLSDKPTIPAAQVNSD